LRGENVKASELMHHLRKKVSGIIMLLVILWIGGFIGFYTLIPKEASNTNITAQAAVVLTGGRERLKTGFDLLCTGKANSLFVSGVHSRETPKSLVKLSEAATNLNCNQRLKSKIFLDYIAKNTRGNAFETALWVRQHSISSLHLVTAAYHMPRSLLEFKKVLPNIVILAHPVFPVIQENSGFWKQGRIFRLAFLEYHKYIYAFVRIHFFNQ
jgi:uncharacterized SAM-binding protein YcdF (DUF218 family)